MASIQRCSGTFASTKSRTARLKRVEIHTRLELYRAENGRVIAHSAMSGLLTTLTGRCTALQTLTLRRIGQNHAGFHWHTAAEENSYTEWALFIRSVQGTVEKLVFEQAEVMINGMKYYFERLRFRAMDERFERLVLPTLVSGKWPGLTSVQLQGVRGSKRQSGTAGVAAKLEVFYGGNTTVVVEKRAYIHEDRRAESRKDLSNLLRNLK
ncbi:hypothetical protein MMC07_001538 [Pseudocyphellaria aurata]|nr:hypothetical protein [Pseudocyphellaria aurata]